MSGYPEHDNMCNTAFEAAAKLTDSIKPTSNDSLESLLQSYAKGIFALKFGFEYRDVPPDAFRAGNGSRATSNSTLDYILDFRIGDDLTWALQNLCGGLDIPLASVRRALEGYMAERCERVIDTNTLRSWDLHWFDNMYGPEDPTQDLPFRQIGVIVGWYDTKRADVNGTPLSIAYTFIMTMVYEVESPHVAATRGLLELFYYKLQSYTINAPRGRKYLDMITIQELLYIYATEEFQRAFGFEYRQDATPPDRRLDTVKIFHSMLYINTLPVPVEQVDGWMVSNVIGRNDCQFPSYAQSSIYDEIRDTVLRCAGGGYSATTWYQASVRSFFLNPDQSHPFHMQHFACYLFIRANMTVKVNGKEDQIQYCLVYYLGLFASYSNNAGAKVVQFDPKKVGAPY